MTLASIKPVTRKYVTCHMLDISNPSSSFVAAPCKGQIMKVSTTIFNAITGSNANMTLKVNGVLTGHAWIVTVAASAAGQTFSATSATTRALARVNEGDVVEFVTDGASSTTTPTTCMLEVEMD